MPVFSKFDELTSIREDFFTDPDSEELRLRLARAAVRAAEQPLRCLTDYRLEGCDPHVFRTEQPYAWPVPGQPGKYINRDGERCPDRFVIHHDLLKDFALSAMILASAGYFLKNPGLLDEAARRIEKWLVDPDTYMKPDFSHTQGLRGCVEGTHSGLIDAVFLFCVLRALELIEADGRRQTLIAACRRWFGELARWIENGEFGQAELATDNNHALWCNALLTACASFANDAAGLARCAERFKHYLTVQPAEDGLLPAELLRTNAYFYSFFALDAMTVTCEAARSAGVDLWTAQAENGRSIRFVLDAMLPYFENPFLWKHSEISGVTVTDSLTYQIAALRLNSGAYAAANKKRRRQLDPMRPRASRLGYLFLLPGWKA